MELLVTLSFRIDHGVVETEEDVDFQQKFADVRVNVVVSCHQVLKL